MCSTAASVCAGCRCCCLFKDRLWEITDNFRLKECEVGPSGCCVVCVLTCVCKSTLHRHLFTLAKTPLSFTHALQTDTHRGQPSVLTSRSVLAALRPHTPSMTVCLTIAQRVNWCSGLDWCQTSTPNMKTFVNMMHSHQEGAGVAEILLWPIPLRCQSSFVLRFVCCLSDLAPHLYKTKHCWSLNPHLGY